MYFTKEKFNCLQESYGHKSDWEQRKGIPRVLEVARTLSHHPRVYHPSCACRALGLVCPHY